MARMDEKRREMILKGDLMKTVLLICLPLALYSFFNSCYTLLDQIICAKISTTAQNAVSSIGQIKSAIAALGAGLAAGGGVLVSRLYGAGKVKDAKNASSNLVFLSILVSGILMIILIPLAEPILKLCRVDSESIKIGVGYFRLQLLELAFVSLNSVFIGLEKAKGNSKNIFKLNILVLLVKLAITCLFIFGFNLKDIIYVELATIIGQLTLTSIGLYYLFNKNNIIKISFKMMIPTKEYISPILTLSIPIFLGKFIMSMGKVVVNAMCGEYWDLATNGLIVGTLGISNNMCGLITGATNSFEEGESSIVSQNIGNKNIKRAVRTFFKTLIVVSIISLTGYILTRFILLDYMIEWFTSPDEKTELHKQMIREIFVWDSLSIPSLGVTAAVLGLLYGFGMTKLSTILNFSRIGSRIVILFIMHRTSLNDNPTLCAGLSMGISNCIILTISISFLVIFWVRLKKNGYKGMYLTDPEPEMTELQYD